MKVSFVLVAALGFFCLVQGSSVTDEQRAKVEEHRKKCLVSSGVALEDVKAIQQGDWSSEKSNVKDFVYCMMHAYEFMDEGGVFNVDVFTSKIPAGADKSNIVAAVTYCLNTVDSKVTREEYAFNLGACYDSKKTGFELF